MRPRISDTASMPQRTGVKQPLTINVQSPPRGKRPVSSDSRVGEWTLRTNPYVYGLRENLRWSNTGQSSIHTAKNPVSRDETNKGSWPNPCKNHNVFPETLGRLAFEDTHPRKRERESKRGQTSIATDKGIPHTQGYWVSFPANNNSRSLITVSQNSS